MTTKTAAPAANFNNQLAGQMYNRLLGDFGSQCIEHICSQIDRLIDDRERERTKTARQLMDAYSCGSWQAVLDVAARLHGVSLDGVAFVEKPNGAEFERLLGWTEAGE